MADASLTDLPALLKELTHQDLPAAMRKTVESMLNQLMEDDVTKLVGAGLHQRSEQRRNQRNGHRRRQLETQLGALEIAIPRLRSGSYFPSFLEPHCRIHASLVGVVQDAYVNGISTRKVEDLTAVLGVEGLSKSSVSRLLKTLDNDVISFRDRPLGRCPYLFIDARYEKVHDGGSVVSKAVYVAVGVTQDGWREVLGFTVAPSEDAVNWHDFLTSLVHRGLEGVALVVSDAHQGIRQAVGEVFPQAQWQRCTIHLERNLTFAVSHKHRKLVGGLFRLVVNADDLETARHNRGLMLQALDDRGLTKAAQVLEQAGDDFLRFYQFPSQHRRKIHSTNLVERLNRELKRRTRVVGVFPNDQSLERLCGALLRQQHLSWQAEEKHYMSLKSMLELIDDDDVAREIMQRYEQEDKLFEAA